MRQKTFELNKINESWELAFILCPKYFLLELIWWQFVINFKDEE